MKKLFLLGFAALMLVSCKKDWNCVCQNKGNVESYTIYNSTKKNAKRQCEDAVYVGAVKVATDNGCSIN